MSTDIETIRADMKANMAAAREMNALSGMDDVIKHLNGTVWPFIECLVDQLEDLDGCVEELMNHEADILQPETGALFLAVITGGVTLMGELKKRLGPGDQKITAAIAEFEKNASEAIGTITEITIPEIDDGDEDGDDDEDDDQDEGDSDEH